MSNKIKRTPQRALLLKFIENTHIHPSAEEIFIHLREKLPHLSKKNV